ncbi:MAG: hypothetical protein GC129_02135 [Proteobacteria bacterium]|nr:hypothetical protein [Pseudomonadota bacterium]
MKIVIGQLDLTKTSIAVLGFIGATLIGIGVTNLTNRKSYLSASYQKKQDVKRSAYSYILSHLESAHEVREAAQDYLDQDAEAYFHSSELKRHLADINNALSQAHTRFKQDKLFLSEKFVARYKLFRASLRELEHLSFPDEQEQLKLSIDNALSDLTKIARKELS